VASAAVGRATRPFGRRRRPRRYRRRRLARPGCGGPLRGATAV